MFKVDIFRMERFLEVVNRCTGPVHLLDGVGQKQNINRHHRIQDELLQKHRDSKRHLRLSLEVPNPRDYRNIVNFVISDF